MTNLEYVTVAKHSAVIVSNKVEDIRQFDITICVTVWAAARARLGDKLRFVFSPYVIFCVWLTWARNTS